MTTSTIRFMQYYVTNGAHKARISYSVDNRVDERKCVTLYARDCLESLAPIFGNLTVNNTDSMTDYFEKDRVTLFEDSPHYAAARKTAEAVSAKYAAKSAAKWAKYYAA